MFFVIFLSPSVRIIIWLGHDHFLPSLFQFTCHPTIPHSILSTERVPLNNLWKKTLRCHIIVFLPENVGSSHASYAVILTCRGAIWWHIARHVIEVRYWVVMHVDKGNFTLAWALSTSLWEAAPLAVRSVGRASVPSCSCTGTIVSMAHTSSCLTRANWPRYYVCLSIPVQQHRHNHMTLDHMEWKRCLLRIRFWVATLQQCSNN